MTWQENVCPKYGTEVRESLDLKQLWDQKSCYSSKMRTEAWEGTPRHLLPYASPLQTPRRNGIHFPNSGKEEWRLRHTNKIKVEIHPRHTYINYLVNMYFCKP